MTVQRYRNGSKKVKQQILDEFCETTGYSRGYARFVLRNHGRQVWLRGKWIVVGDVHKRQQRHARRLQVNSILGRHLDSLGTSLFTPRLSLRSMLTLFWSHW